MIFSKLSRYILALQFSSVAMMVSAEEPLHYEASLTAGTGSGTFAPYYLSSIQHGRITQADNVQAEVAVTRKMDFSNRFSYGYGIDLVGGYASATTYEYYDESLDGWNNHRLRPSAAWIQQLYAEIKYRSLFLEAGLKEQRSGLLNQNLTSGDLVESGNARPMPQMRAGFLDFQDIPFTGGWLQIKGEGAFGYMTDNGWLKDHYNYFNAHIAFDQIYNYKCVYFRTKPSKPFSMIFGMQAAATFGGRTEWYSRGKIERVVKHDRSLRYFVKMMFPTQDGGDGFYSGNHLGSWDIRARYRLKNADEIYAYTSWLWDDGSGIGKLNGFDGLWGVEYKAARKGLINSAVFEYFDFTNQSGPIHFDPADNTGCNLPAHVSGADDYYNNATYNPYAYYGLSIGSPVMMAPLYNRDGVLSYIANAVRGFHVAAEGSINPVLDYRVKTGYRKGWGTAKRMLKRPMRLSAFMMEAEWHPKRLGGMSVRAAMEIDNGNMPEKAFGVMLGVRYSGLLKL
ncbi:MAG: capsule assembly Wzi family protein [Bacteroides sp.]|nr:capsule assembly Wzi family protein [Bacteroides sp.]MBD5334665.1 capsule assembly Wzi family protein [Bacteroides sp.]